MKTTFHEEDSRYALVVYQNDRKNVTYLYFREGEWYVTESFEESWDHPNLSASRFFTVQGFTGPLTEYIQQYQEQSRIDKQAKVVKTTLGEFMDTLMFGDRDNVSRN